MTSADYLRDLPKPIIKPIVQKQKQVAEKSIMKYDVYLEFKHSIVKKEWEDGLRIEGKG